jgi:hypothetical protein
MGNLTTITFYNDAYWDIEKNPQQVMENILAGMDGSLHQDQDTMGSAYAPIGSHSNAMTVQRTRHANSKTVYVHMGNTVMDMDPYSEQIRKLKKNNPEFYNQLLSKLKETVKELEKLETD